MKHRWLYLAAVLLLLVLFAQLLFSAKVKSPTVDEPNHLTRGYVYLKTGDLRFSRTTGHPPLLNALCALPLTLLQEIGPPQSYAGWEAGFLNAYATTFVFRNRVPLDRLIFLGRLPAMAMTMVMVALLARWARQLYGMWGSFVLVLCAFDPNLIAHGRLATTDVGVALFFALTLYLFWCFLTKPSLVLLCASGVALGLAQCAKFSAILLLPVLGISGLIQALDRNSTLAVPKRPRIAGQHWLSSLLALSGAMTVVIVLAVLTIWAVYGFGTGRPSGWSATVPAPAYVEGLRTILTRVSTDRPTFLLGQRLTQARWDYFLVAFALKTPLPLLIALLLALVSNLWWRPRRNEWPLWVISTLYFATSARSALNLGYRHLMPVLPFVWIYAGRLGRFLSTQRSSVPRLITYRALVGLFLLAWQAIGTLFVYPDYLAYFNELAGGPDGGWRYLVDSNLDWGQDLYALKSYTETHSDTPIYLSWFGTTYPYLYDIDLQYRHLPGHYSFPYSNEMARSPYNPIHPQPGLYAISATNLQMGVSEGDIFARFRQQEPIAQIGHSIFIYNVAASQAVADPTCIAGPDLDDLGPETLQKSLGRGVGWVKWFDLARAFVLPEANNGTFVLTSAPLAFAPDWQADFFASATLIHHQDEVGRRPAITVYDLPASSVGSWRQSWLISGTTLSWSQATRFDDTYPKHPLSTPVRFDYGLELLGYRLLASDTLNAGQPFELVTMWQANAAMPPSTGDLTAFVHLLDAAGQVRSGEDRLDLEPLTWQPGDMMIQLHRMPIPANTPSGTYQVELGLYIPDTMQRLTIYDRDEAVADRLLLQPIHIISP